MNFVDLATLQTFIAVCEQPSFERAAGVVFRTQAAVSQQMKRLEQQLGVVLFIKHGRSNQLTSEGKKLLSYARRMVSLHGEMVLQMQSIDQEVRLRIAASADVSETILPDLIRRFTDVHPHVNLQIQVGRSPALIEEVLEGKSDIAIGTRWHPDLPFVVMRSSPIVWIAARDFRLQPGPIPLILSDEPSIFRRIALDMLERAGIQWREQYTSSTLAGIRSAVRAGIGITARTVEMMSNDFQVLGSRDRLPSLGEMTFYTSIRRDEPNAAAEAFFKMLGGAPAQKHS